MFRTALISICIICSAVSAKTPVYEDFKLLASDGASDDKFGSSVSISKQGPSKTFILGARGDDDTGSAYIHELVGGVWKETKLAASDGASDDRFGSSVSISGDGTTVIVGAYRDDDNGFKSGSAYIYRLIKGVWQETKLLVSDGAIGHRFGHSVSISSDGTTAIVGSPGNVFGSAYIYKLVGGVWQETRLTPSDVEHWIYFGWSVSISGDGTTALVGANYADNYAGSAYIYELVGGVWQETKLTASDGNGIEEFGHSVSISGDGTAALVGAPYGDDFGSAYIYNLDSLGGIWQETKLTASDGAPNHRFGWSVSISSDGTTAIVGADQEEIGTGDGSAYIYELLGGNWQETKLLASDGASDDRFGGSVCISGDGTAALVGADRDDDNGTDSGSAYFFDIDGQDCPDINGDGNVNVSDLLAIIDQWGLTNSPADVNKDGIVDVTDLLIVIDNWGACE